MAMIQASLFTPVAAVGRIPERLTVADFPGLSKRDRARLQAQQDEPNACGPLPRLLAAMAAGGSHPDFERVAINRIAIPAPLWPEHDLRQFLHARAADVLGVIDGRRLVGATDIGPLVRDRRGRLWAWGDPLAVFVLQSYGADIELVAPVFPFGGAA